VSAPLPDSPVARRDDLVRRVREDMRALLSSKYGRIIWKLRGFMQDCLGFYGL
jgi:hypothetical protein